MQRCAAEDNPEAFDRRYPEGPLYAHVVGYSSLLFGDTGYHFAETLGFRDYVAGHYDVNVRSLQPELSVAEQDQRYGEHLWQRDPDLCCRLRKTVPLDAAGDIVR